MHDKEGIPLDQSIKYYEVISYYVSRGKSNLLFTLYPVKRKKQRRKAHPFRRSYRKGSANYSLTIRSTFVIMAAMSVTSIGTTTLVCCLASLLNSSIYPSATRRAKASSPP